MNDGAERAHAVRILAILVFLGVMGATAALEPDGPVMFRPTWSEPDPLARDVELHGLGTELRLDVVPGVAIREAALEVRLPPGVDGTPLGLAAGAGVETELERDGTTVLRIALGRLAPGAERGMRFRLRLERDAGSIATFAVLGLDDRGAPIRDAAGVVVGIPGEAPARRHGAVEYRAVTIPDPDPSVP